MRRVRIEGRLELEGPSGLVRLDGRGDCVELHFPTVWSAIQAWRRGRTFPLELAARTAGLAVDVFVRGVRVRRFGRAS